MPNKAVLCPPVVSGGHICALLACALACKLCSLTIFAACASRRLLRHNALITGALVPLLAVAVGINADVIDPAGGAEGHPCEAKRHL